MRSSCLWCRKSGSLCPAHLAQRRRRWTIVRRVLAFPALSGFAFLVIIGIGKLAAILTEALRAVCG